MLRRRFYNLLLCCAIIASIAMITPSFAQQLNVGVSVSTSAQREAFYTLARDFETLHPNSKVQFTALSSEDYKLAFPTMLAKDKRFDVLYWHAGQRLFNFVEKEFIHPIDDLWLENELDNAFDGNVRQNLSYNGRYYAVPISYYQIGFYYSKEIFERLSLSEPKTWQEFIALCEIIKADGVSPIFIGTKSNWPATAWFDYLNLRLNGLDFHHALTQGKVPFNDERVRDTLNVLQALKARKYFIADHQDFHWRESLPLLSRGLVGMSLIGNYVIQDIRKDMLSKIGFFPFPQISEGVGKYEEAPIDVLVIPKQAKNLSLAKKFLAFAASHEVQTKLNKKLGVISPNKSSQQQTSPLTKEAYLELSTAEGFSQFFDRDANEAFAKEVMPIIDEFMVHGDVTIAITKLELARSQHFPTTTL
jgi:multiple sugar transport system substrate-binding protein